MFRFIKLGLLLGALLFSSAWGLSFAENRATYTQLQQQFMQPDDSVRPWVFYFVLNGTLSQEAITADFEAMARVGIGGIIFMEVDAGTPQGPNDFGSEGWLNLMSYALKEAKRLGLEVDLNNDAGWNGSGGPWITPELSTKKIVWSETVIEPGTPTVKLSQPEALRNYYQDIAVMAMPKPRQDVRLPDIEVKSAVNALINRNYGPLGATFSETPVEAIISSDKIIDITHFMQPDGTLAWHPDSGEWLVMRFGNTTVGKENHPAPEAGRGLECDKLDKNAATFHFNHLIKRIINRNKTLCGQGEPLVAMHIDSWENGAQNWTPMMREEFKRRRGYEMFKYLPVLSGRVVDDTETSERFLWDVRQTVAELLVENYAGTMRDLAHQNGLRLTIEAYGEPSDDMAYANCADEPMGEFWIVGKYEGDFSCTEMASASHIYGKPVTGAEAFTSWGSERWQSHPGNMKDLADWAFCEGINKIVFHRYAAQPFNNAIPGVCMGPFGTHYERTQTWWEQTAPWHEYLSRCQLMLRKGQYVADVLYLSPEGTPRNFHAPEEAFIAPHIRGSYGFDGCSYDVVLNGMDVSNGRITLPSGMSYSALVLPDVETMTPALIAKIDELAAKGAFIISPTEQYPFKSPSLSDKGEGDSTVVATARRLWQSGKVKVTKNTAEALAAASIQPDFTSEAPLRWIHRKSGTTDIYFVANPYPIKIISNADFRVSGRTPEFWNPRTGESTICATFMPANQTTRVHLELEPYESTFVVFDENNIKVDPITEVTCDDFPIWSFEKSHKPTIDVIKASYGVPGDSTRLIDVTETVRNLVDQNRLLLKVSEVSQGRDPAVMILKTLTVDYTFNGHEVTTSATDGNLIALAHPAELWPVTSFDVDAKGKMTFTTSKEGKYGFTTASGKHSVVNVPHNAQTLELTTPWEVSFSSATGKAFRTTFPTLVDWATHADSTIRYFSGCATYKSNFTMPRIKKGDKVELSLGDVEVMAEVTLNGKKLGTLWHAPYAVDITDEVKSGENLIEIKVTNLWINRQIGDSRLPSDAVRNDDGSLKEWPQWLLDGETPPNGRESFVTWQLYGSEDQPVASGLMGPVRIQIKSPVKL